MPHELLLLEDLLILLLASVPVAFLFNRFRLPTILGFMVTGVLVGPYGLRLIHEVEAIRQLAEIGVVLSMFTIGLEFSLPRLLEMRRLVLAGGAAQMALTVLVVAGLGVLIGRSLNQAILFGFLVASSSTAIVQKLYVERGEVHTPHARATSPTCLNWSG